MKLNKWVGFLSTALLTCSMAFAHVSNENTIYDDTQYSNAKEDLVYLRTLGVIPYTHEANIYMPQDILTKKDLGYWAAQFPVNDANKTEDDYTKEALDKKLIDSTDGNATYKEVVVAFFGEDALKDKDIQETIKGKENDNLTREEFALFLGKFVKRDNHQGLFDKAGMEEGPNGKIDDVTANQITENNSTFEVYSMTVDGKEIKINGHPKALHGSAELEEWKGKTLTETWMKKNADGEDEVVLLALEKGAMKTDTQTTTHNSHKTENKSTFPWVLAGGIIVAILLLFVVAKSRKR